MTEFAHVVMCNDFPHSVYLDGVEARKFTENQKVQSRGLLGPTLHWHCLKVSLHKPPHPCDENCMAGCTSPMTEGYGDPHCLDEQQRKGCA